MHLTRKFDRAFQWAGEKIGGEKTDHSEEFKSLETEMNLRQEGMEKLQKSTNGYVKWINRRGEAYDDKEKGLPIAYVGRMMVTHGEDYEPDSEYGNNLIALGRANMRIAEIQESYGAEITQNWVEAVERSLAMMKDYQGARKKHESRRLAYDASISKLQKAKRDDYRIEEEMRSSRAKFEESGEDVMRRMQDIKEAEGDNVRDLTGFLDAELEYHERCAEELRRVRQAWGSGVAPPSPVERSVRPERRPTGRSRTNTARSFNDYSPRNQLFEEPEAEREPEPLPVRLPFRSHRSEARFTATPEPPARPSFGRSQTYQGASNQERRASAIPSMPSISALRSQNNSRPASRFSTAQASREDVFADDYDDESPSGSGSPSWGGRSTSPATSMGSLTRSTSNLAKKAPPPPPPCRSKKPAPPVPPKRATEVGY